MTTTNDGKRLFVGARVSVSTTNQLAQASETLARRARDANLDVRWAAPTGYHLTLKFLGWTHVDAISALRDAITTAIAGTTGFKIRVARLGAFPSLEKASVIWAGCEDPGGALAQLAARIETASVALGFSAEPRPFHPHVTIGRLKETRGVREVVLPLSEQMFSDTRIDGVSVFESETKSSSSTYQEIFRMGFKPASIRSPGAEKRQTGALDLGDETDDGWPRGHGQ